MRALKRSFCVWLLLLVIASLGITTFAVPATVHAQNTIQCPQGYEPIRNNTVCYAEPNGPDCPPGGAYVPSTVENPYPGCEALPVAVNNPIDNPVAEQPLTFTYTDANTISLIGGNITNPVTLLKDGGGYFVGQAESWGSQGPVGGYGPEGGKCYYDISFLPSAGDPNRGGVTATYTNAPLGSNPQDRCRPASEIAGGVVDVNAVGEGPVAPSSGQCPALDIEGTIVTGALENGRCLWPLRYFPNGCSNGTQVDPAGGPYCVALPVIPPKEGGPDGCPVKMGSALRWLVCGAFHLMGVATNTLDYFINQYLQTGNKIFTPAAEGGQKESFYKAWLTFRNFALALVVIAGLVMLICEALSIPIVDAYTVRKVLPRLFIAVLGISLSWEFSRFMIGIFDDLGQAMGSIIYSSFDIQGGVEVWAAITTALLLGGSATIAAILLTGAGLISLLGTLLMALVVAVATLVIRQAIIAAAVMLAPLAIAAYVLPNTSKYAKFWWDTFFRMLLLYPIATGIIALCKVLGLIIMTNPGSDTQGDAAVGQLIATVVGIIFFFLGYAVLPMAFKLTGGMVARLGGIANDRSRGGFDRLKNFRREKVQSNVQAAKEGRGGFVGANMLGAGIRRATMSGGLIPTARSQARYRAAVKQMRRNVADEAAENDNGFASGNDEANAIATQAGMTRGRFESEYAQMLINQAASRGETLSQSAANRQAQDARAELERGYGAQMGTDAMRLSAFKSRAGSNKGYNAKKPAGHTGPFDVAAENYRDAFSDAASLINDGIINTSDAAHIITSNRNRFEFSNMEHHAVMHQLDATAGRMRSNPSISRDQLVTDHETEHLADTVLNETNPYYMMKGRYESLNAMTPHIERRVMQAAAQSRTDRNPDALDKELAHVANLFDSVGRGNVEQQEILGGFMEKEIDYINNEGNNERITLRAAMDRSRSRPASSAGNSAFRARRKERDPRPRRQSPAQQDNRSGDPPAPNDTDGEPAPRPTPPPPTPGTGGTGYGP